MERATALEPRFERIADGVTALVVERPRFLPPSLELLLCAMTIDERLPVRVFGFARACADTDHRLVEWVRGRYRLRDLRLSMCADCGIVEVRDVSLDTLPGLRVGASGPRRRNDLIGHYTGRRVAGRIYF